MMTPTENRHTMTSPASTSERRRARAQAGRAFAGKWRALAGVALVCALALGAEGDVATGNNTLANGASARAQVAREDAGAGFLYSRWIREGGGLISLPPGKGSRVGNSKLTPLPPPLPGGKGEDAPGSFWGDVAGKVRERAVERLRGSLLGVLPKPEELRAILIRYGNGEEFDMAQWREIRRQQLKAAVENAPLAFYADTEQSLASAISQTAVDRLGFVRRARVDFRTSLGDRRASGGVDAAGALRESADEVIGWQLRAYAGEGGNKGGNIGAFWRRAQWLHFVDEGLLGANIFADYEDTDGGSFWRWSIGGEMKTRAGDVNVNRYFVLTDPVVLANNRRVYSRAGLDIDAALNIPGAEWAQARVGYFLWEGEFGDADIEGFKAGFDIKPGAGIVVGVEFDGESGDIGGNFAYTHNIGEPFASAQGAGVFDPRAHFFDAVRREYSQRIVNTGAGDGANFAVIVSTGLNFTVRGELPGASTTVSTLNITAANFTTGVNDEFAITGNVTVETAETPAASMAVFRQKGGNWHLTLNANSEVAFGSTARVLIVNRGSGEFERVNPPNPERVVIQGRVTLSLIGTRFRFGVPSVSLSQTDKASITLVEGGMMADMAAMDRVTIKVGERASVMVMMGGSMVVVGCGAGQVANAGGAGARCSSGGSVDLTPVDAPPNVSVADGRVLVPFGALATVGHFDVAMLAAETTLTASVETAGFGIAAVTSADGMTVTYDVVLQEAQATIAGAKNPRVIVSDIAEFVRPITVVFTVQVARKLQVGVTPAQVEVTQNIVRSGIAGVNAAQGTPPYSYNLLSPANLFNLGGDGGNIINNNARIQSTGSQNVVVEATDALRDKATVTLSVNVPPTPQLAIVSPGAGETVVVATNSVAVEAVQFVGRGGVPPLRFELKSGANYVTVAAIPSSAGNGQMTVFPDGRLLVRGDTAERSFDLVFRVVDSININTERTIQVSLSEGLVLSGPVVNALFTVTTHGGGGQSGVRRTLGAVVGQSQANINNWRFIAGGSYVGFDGGGNTSARRTIVYNGSHNSTGFLTVSVEVSDDSGGEPTPDKATASFRLQVVNPPNVEAGLDGDINLRYFVGTESAILTATASGGAGGNVFRISVGNSGARVGNDGVLLYNGRNTNALTVTVFADDNHSGTDATPAVTVILSALARLRAESITRPRITTGSTLSGANAIVVTVSVSGGENRAAFAYSRIGEGTQLTGADINNSGVIFAADNTRIDADEIGGNRGGNRNFVYEVVDGAIEARRQTLTATAVIESIVPQPIAAGVSRIGNEVITVGADAMARLRITPSGGGGAYNFMQANAANIVMAGAQAEANNAAAFIVSINAPNAAGTASVSIVIDDEHFATAPYTVARRFIAINELAASYAGGANFSPLTAAADIKFATINIAGGLNPGAPTFAGRTGPNAADLRIEDRAADNRQFALVLGGGARNTVERTITFAVSVPAANGDAVTISGTVEVVDKVQLRGGGRITVFAEADAGDVVAEFKPVGGVPPYSDLNKLLPATFPGGLQESAAAKSVTITRTNTDLTAGDEHIIAYEVSDSTDGGALYATATATITVINALSAALDFAGGALDTGVETTVATLSAGGGAGGYAFSANNNAVSFVEGTIAVARLNNVGTVNVDLIADDDNAAVTEPVTLNIALTALAPLTLPPLPPLTLTTAANPGSAPLLTLAAAQGGQPPYEYGRYDAERFVAVASNAQIVVSPRGVVEIRSQTVIYGAGRNARSNAGLETQLHPFAVRDSSTPPRVFGLPNFTIDYVLPPSVVVNVNQTVRRHRKGVSVTLATLTYSGGSGAAGLTASVLSFYQANSQATVIDDEVVVLPDPAVTQRGTARAVVVAYDSANGTSPKATVTLPLYVVDALRWTSPPTTPLTVTTQDNQSGTFTSGDALPRLLGVVGGNVNNEHNLGSRTDGFNLGTQNQQFSYTGNGGRFAQEAQTVTVTVYGTDRNAADNYRQTTSLTITVAFIDPQEEITIGFAPGFDTSPLTAAGAITIGEVIVGGGLRAKDAVILGGNGGDFSIEDSDSADSGTVRLILGGVNMTDRVTAVTLSGDDNHTRTNAALVTVTVNVVDRVKLRGAGARYTVLAQAGNAVAEIFAFEPIGGMPDETDGYSVQTAIEPATPPTGFTRTGTRTVAIGRNAVSITTGEHIFIQEVADTADTVRGTATVQVINELALSVGDNAGGDAFRGDVNLPGGFPFGQGFASGGAGAYTYRVEGPGIGGGRQDVRVGNDGVMVASHSSTHPAATITYTLIADDGADVTEPATVEFTLTVLQPVAAAPLPVITVTTKSTPGGAGAAGPPQTVTTRVEFPYEVAGALGQPGFNGRLRTSVSIVITVAPGANVTVNRALGTELNNIQGNRRAYIVETDSTNPGFAIGTGIDMDSDARAYTLTPYPALSGGGGGGGTVPAFTIDASGGQPDFSYHLSGAQTPGALADILYYTADSASNGIVYFNAGVQARAAAGDVTVAHNLQVRDSSAPTRNANVPGMLTIRYVLPPPVTVAVNQTVAAYKTGVSISVAALTYSGGESGNLAATVRGAAGDTDDITVLVSGGDVLVSASAAGTITATINAYDADNDTAENDTAILTVEFVPPLTIHNIPAATLTVTTRGSQPAAPTDGFALPREMTASGGNGGYQYDLEGVIAETVLTINNSGILSNKGVVYNGNDVTLEAVIVATDAARNGYSQTERATIAIAYIHPPALSMGFVETPLVAALTTANDITIGTIALTGGLAELSIVITGHADFELSLIESSSATAALILSGGNDGNANATARTVSVTITGNDNHMEIAAQLLSITVRINDALTIISAPPVITITAGKIDGFTGEENTAAIAQLMVQGNLSDDITVSIIDAAADNLTMSLRNLLSLTGATAAWTLAITSNTVAQTLIGEPYNLAFEIRDAAMSVATVTIPVSVVNAPVRADTAVTAITTYFYTGFTSEVTLTSIALTNLYIPDGETASFTITVAPATGENTTASQKYTAALSAITNAAGAVEIKYTRPTAENNTPQPADDFTLNATVIISTGAESKNPFTTTATLQWRIGGIPALSINFQSPPNTVFIRGHQGTIGVLTVSTNSNGGGT